VVHPFRRERYVLLYRTDGETVAILAVRHTKEAGY
jgi:plasmid stabilization system protein ParE